MHGMIRTLLGVVVIYGTATLVESLYLAPSRELKQAVAAAEEQLEHQRATHVVRCTNHQTVHALRIHACVRQDGHDALRRTRPQARLAPGGK